MSSVQSGIYDWSYVYTVDPHTFLVKRVQKDTNGLSRTIESLSKINPAYPRLDRVTAVHTLTCEIIQQLSMQNRAKYGFVASLIPSNTLSSLKELERTLAKQISKLQTDYTQCIQAHFLTQSSNILAAAAKYITATPELRKTELFEAVRVSFVQEVPNLLLKASLDVLFTYVLVMDTDLDWTSSFVNLAISDRKYSQIMGEFKQVVEERTKETLTLQETHTLHLARIFLLIYSYIEQLMRCSEKRKAELAVYVFEIAKQCLANKDVEWETVLDLFGEERPRTLEFLTYFCCDIADMSLTYTPVLPLIRSLVFFLVSKEGEFFWLEAVMHHHSDKSLLKPLVEALESHTLTQEDHSRTYTISRRYQQLSRLNQVTLTKPEMLRFAYFIEQTALQTCHFTGQHYDKSTSLVPGTGRRPKVGRNFEKDAVNGACTILLPRKGSRFEGIEGLYKKPRLAVYLPFDTNKEASLICRTANRSFFRTAGSDEKTALKDCYIQELEEEAAFQESISHVRGIWPLLGRISYTVHKKDHLRQEHTIRKISLLSPLGVCGSLFRKMNPSLSARLQYALDLAHGLHYLHTHKHYHGDVKDTNSLLQLNVDKVERAGWIDFGHSVGPQLIQNGFYGTVDNTAPELLSTRNFAGDFAALDIWAFGCMLFRLFKNTKPSWVKQILKHISCVDPEIHEIQRKQVNEHVEKEIETPLRALLKKEQLSFEEEIDWLILNTLRKLPANRLQAEAITKKLEELLAQNLS